MLHSDQGWQYRHDHYRRLLGERSLTQSMFRKGDCLDNAAMESFFGTLKAEFFHLGRFNDVGTLQDGIDEYIDYYNNPTHQSEIKRPEPGAIPDSGLRVANLLSNFMGSVHTCGLLICSVLEFAISKSSAWF